MVAGTSLASVRARGLPRVCASRINEWHRVWNIALLQQVHVLSRESSYKSFSLQQATVLEPSSTATFQFGIRGNLGLVAIKHLGASNSTEIHQLAATLKGYVLQTKTALPVTPDPNSLFQFTTNSKGDLYGIKVSTWVPRLTSGHAEASLCALAALSTTHLGLPRARPSAPAQTGLPLAPAAHSPQHGLGLTSLIAPTTQLSSRAHLVAPLSARAPPAPSLTGSRALRKSTGRAPAPSTLSSPSRRPRHCPQAQRAALPSSWTTRPTSGRSR